MKVREVDILIVPGWTNSGQDHWQSRWERNLATARRVEQADWDKPKCADWVAQIVSVARKSSRPAVLVAHSCGVAAVAHAAVELINSSAVGAFLVAPPDLSRSTDWPARGGGFHPMPMDPMPFPTVVIASSDDPHCSVEAARGFAHSWRAQFVEAGNCGHLNEASGHGPWPEGLLRFGAFLKSLGPAPLLS
jgi:predicted alpha/beta hydrolase family esterase